MSNTRIYNIWKGMRKRCNNPNSNTYKYYGGRGIRVCREWDDFLNFYNWSISNGYQEALSIDRVDYDGDYTPDNCRWVTSEIQNSNTRKNKEFKATSPGGEIFYHDSNARFAKEHNLNREYIRSCLIGKQKTYKGWRFEYI